VQAGRSVPRAIAAAPARPERASPDRNPRKHEGPRPNRLRRAIPPGLRRQAPGEILSPNIELGGFDVGPSESDHQGSLCRSPPKWKTRLSTHGHSRSPSKGYRTDSSSRSLQISLQAPRWDTNFSRPGASRIAESMASSTSFNDRASSNVEPILANGGSTISAYAPPILSRSPISFALTTPVDRAHRDRNPADLRDRLQFSKALGRSGQVRRLNRIIAARMLAQRSP